ncbi:MAG: class I SAM-dependent methyltransferase, partial [Caldilineaceae bacterium]
MNEVWSLYRDLYLWACERLYHELAPAYDWAAAAVSLGAWDAWRRSALAHLPPADDAQSLRVLELGPGTGALLAQMVDAGHTVVGLERSAPMVATALASQPWRGRAPLCQGDARALPFGAASFDAALATFPAPFILEAATLAEAARVIRPGGRLIVVGLWTSAPQWRPGGIAQGIVSTSRAGE